MIKVKKRKRVRVSPSAMSDIAFLLLIFLMSTASFDGDNEINLPFFKYAEKSVVQEEVLINMRSGGEIIYAGSLLTESEVISLLAEKVDGTVVKLFADGNTPYIKVNSFLTLLQELEKYRVILMAEKNKG